MDDKAVREALPSIERDEAYQRDYIPMPGGWEVQTKGKGSTFRICGPDDERLAIPASPYLHQTLEQMARDVHAASAAQAAELAEVREVRDELLRDLRTTTDCLAQRAETAERRCAELVAERDELASTISSESRGRSSASRALDDAVEAKPVEEVTEGITFYPQVQPNEEVFPQMQGYRMACCDCGLVHVMNFRVVEVVGQADEVYSVAEPDNAEALRIVLTATRDDEETERIRSDQRHTCDESDECEECDKQAVCKCGDWSRKGWRHSMVHDCKQVMTLIDAASGAGDGRVG
jgi:hypothetical protein